MRTEHLIQEIKANKIITEKQINLLKRRLNSGEKIDLSFVYDNEIRLTPEQEQKGLNFLLNLWKTPKGQERKNNPFGYREQDALKDFSHFTFNGFYDASKYGQTPYYLPIYTVCGVDYCFEYYYNFEKINIIG